MRVGVKPFITLNLHDLNDIWVSTFARLLTSVANNVDQDQPVHSFSLILIYITRFATYLSIFRNSVKSINM